MWVLIDKGCYSASEWSFADFEYALAYGRGLQAYHMNERDDDTPHDGLSVSGRSMSREQLQQLPEGVETVTIKELYGGG